MKVLRISRHPADEARTAFLQKIFGAEVEILDHDIEYGSDPVAAVKRALEELGDVVAVEAIAPFPVLMRLVDARRSLGLPLIRAEFARDEKGRALVVGQDASGRDILAFDRYVELVRLSIETNELTRPG